MGLDELQISVIVINFCYFTLDEFQTSVLKLTFDISLFDASATESDF